VIRDGRPVRFLLIAAFDIVSPMQNILLSLQSDLEVAEFVDLLRRSTLAERRPIDDLPRMEGMLRNADIVATARDVDGRLIGLARAITDYHFCTYLADLAVDRQNQRQGVGKRLIDFVHQAAGKQTTIIVLAAPAAVDYYGHIGMTRHESCWIGKTGS
jgi:GNAT superfamily N-acetyltransferase